MACNCPIDNLSSFCGRGIVTHSMCLLPPIDPVTNTTTITLTPPLASEVIIEYIDCGLIIVCGKYTKTVTNVSASATIVFSEQIPFQFSIEDPGIVDLINTGKYTVEYVEVKEVCNDFTCQKPGTTTYYKLNEKDIISVRVKYEL